MIIGTWLGLVLGGLGTKGLGTGLDNNSGFISPFSNQSINLRINFRPLHITFILSQLFIINHKTSWRSILIFPFSRDGFLQKLRRPSKQSLSKYFLFQCLTPSELITSSFALKNKTVSHSDRIHLTESLSDKFGIKK